MRDSKDLTADGRAFKQGRRRNPRLEMLSRILGEDHFDLDFVQSGIGDMLMRLVKIDPNDKHLKPYATVPGRVVLYRQWIEQDGWLGDPAVIMDSGKKGEWEIVDGNHRILASRGLLPEIPAWVPHKSGDKFLRRNPSMNMRDITKTSISILHAEPKGSEWRKVRSAKGVNNGACDLWATVAQEKYGGEIVFFDRDDRRSGWEQYDRPPHGWGHGSAGTAHCAVLLDGRYYDAENPTGVESVADLNYMKRW